MLVALHPLSTLACPEYPGAHRIFGGICWGLRAVCGERDLAAFLELCAAGDPPVLLSAGFPWTTHAGRRIEFLPAPMLPSAPAGASWLSRSLWTGLVGDPLGSAPTFSPRAVRVGPAAAATADEVIAEAELPLPAAADVRRRGREGAWSHAEIAFPAGTGWWFLAHVRKPEWAERLRGAVRWTCDTGWGADRSAGKGVARAVFETNPLPADETAAAAGRFVTLSDWHPTPAEREHVERRVGEAEYALLLRDGASHAGRPMLAVAAGSVLPRPPSPILGTCPLVTADGQPPARRWGFAYPVMVRAG